MLERTSTILHNIMLKPHCCEAYLSLCLVNICEWYIWKTFLSWEGTSLADIYYAMHLHVLHGY